MTGVFSMDVFDLHEPLCWAENAAHVVAVVHTGKQWYTPAVAVCMHALATPAVLVPHPALVVQFAEHQSGAPAESS
jgi:hypothetical protein